MNSTRQNRPQHLLLAAAAAFCTYFCMYAFRKPFTAGTFEDAEISGYALKPVLVISQLAGYMLSKFIGIKVVSEMRSSRRAIAIVVLILAAEAALVGFAYAPQPLKVVMLFLNGLPLGMVFGLVLAYLEGRRQTEALSAVLCASFIMSSGVVKSVGRWLIEERGISEYQMPMVVGLIFFVPLLLSVRVLNATPPPDHHDRILRRERRAISRSERRRFLIAYWPGLALLVFVYVALTVARTVRDDFGVEIWKAMGVSETPSVFATSETVVAVVVTVFNAAAILIAHNLAAMRATVWMMCVSFGLVALSAGLQAAGVISPFVFMVSCGIGLYVPYVAFHTTVFERLIASSRHPSNLGFLMYLADAVGYLGYVLVLIVRTQFLEPGYFLPFFRITLWVVAVGSIVALSSALVYFHKVLRREDESTRANDDGGMISESIAATPHVPGAHDTESSSLESSRRDVEAAEDTNVQ